MSNANSKRKNDIILLIGFLFVGIILVFFVNMHSKDGGSVDIQVDGEVVASYKLSDDCEVPLNYNGYNLLRIESGQARIIKADCPDKLCTQQRRISRSGETITCLPNRTVIKISEGDEREFDGVVE